MASGEEKNNFTRLSTLIIDFGTPALRDKFNAHHPPTSLAAFLSTPIVNKKLQNLKSKRILTAEQWLKLYPAPGLPPVSSNDFDISLLVILLRNVCGLAKWNDPVWTNTPSPADISVEADITRLRMGRNELYAHCVKMALDDAKFTSSWAEIETALNRLAASRYAADIQALKTQAMDSVLEKVDNDLFLSWGDYEERAIDAIQKLDDKFNEFTLGKTITDERYQEKNHPKCFSGLMQFLKMITSVLGIVNDIIIR